NLTLITNFSYSTSFETDEKGFFLLHRGKLFTGGKWDSSCSVAYNMHPAWMQNPTYIAMFANGNISFGAGDPPIITQEGSGGMQNNEGISGAPTLWGWVKVGSDTLLIVAVAEHHNCPINASTVFKRLFLNNIPASQG